MGEIEDWVRGLISSVYDWATGWFNYLDNNIWRLWATTDYFRSEILDIWDFFDNIYTDIEDKLESLKTSILSHVADNLVKPLSDYVDACFMDIMDWIIGIKGDISDILTSLETVFDFIGRIDDIIDDRIESFKEKIVYWVEDKFIYIIERVLMQEVKQ